MDPPGGEGGGDDGVKNIGFLVKFAAQAAQEAYLLECSKYTLLSGTK